jgi:hypothetical protein
VAFAVDYLVAGAAGAGAGVASGAGVAAGAGAGAVFAAGFCSSAFLHPTTAKDNAAKKNSEKMTANTFFMGAPPFKNVDRGFSLNEAVK